MESVSEKKKINVKRILTIAVPLLVVGVLVVLGIKATGEFTKTRNAVADLRTKTDGLQTQNSNLQAKSDELEKKVNALQGARAGSGSAQAPAYNVTTDRYAREPGSPYQETGTDVLFLNLSVTNTSKENGFIATSELRLKDSGNHSYEPFGNYPISGYPQGLLALSSQALKPSETITGTLVYRVPTGTKDFTLSYQNASLKITATR